MKTLDSSQLIVFNNIVQASYWGSRFENEKATIKNIKVIVKEVGL